MERSWIHEKAETRKPRHKGGRPPLKVKREAHVKVRLTAAEQFLIRSKAKEAGMRISDWIRAAALTAKIIPRLSKEDNDLLRMLAGMANNLNQIARQANAGGILTIARKCMALLEEIDQAITYFNKDDRQDTQTGKKL